MSETKLKNKVMSGMIWKFSERIGAQGISFIVQIVLARILDPDAFGVIALVTIFITLSNVFVTSGFASALVQKKDADDLDFSTVFYYSLAFSLVIYAALFFAAPLIANFYGQPILTSVVRVMGLRLPIAAVNSIQHAVVSRKMIFKKFFFATLIGTIGSAAVGILMALNGFGVWALVAQYLFNVVVDTIVLWFTVRWRPRLMFSFARMKWLFSYGWKILSADLLNSLFQNIRGLIIGKVYSSEDLAYYNRGKRFPYIIVENINSSINSVLFPAFATKQEDLNAVKAMMKRAIKTSSYIMCPMMMGMACMATTIVRLVLTDKWLICVPFLQIACFQYMMEPVQAANRQAVKGLGRSDIILKNNIIKKTVAILLLVASVPFGVFWIAMSGLITAVIEMLINMYPNRTLVKYGYLEQLKDLLPSIAISMIMGAAVVFIGLIDMPLILVTALQVMTGIIIYVGISAAIKLDSFVFLLDILKKWIRRKGQ